jgi:hypothetical protein
MIKLPLWILSIQLHVMERLFPSILPVLALHSMLPNFALHSSFQLSLSFFCILLALHLIFTLCSTLHTLHSTFATSCRLQHVLHIIALALHDLCWQAAQNSAPHLKLMQLHNKMLMQTQCSIAFVNSTSFNLYLSVLENCENHKEFCKYKNRCIKRATSRAKGERKEITHLRWELATFRIVWNAIQESPITKLGTCRDHVIDQSEV